MIKKADVVVDATPGGVGLKNKPMYEEHKVRAIYQGGEKHTTTGFSFNSSVNYAEAKGRQFTRVVSCNTTGLVRIIHEMDKEFGVEMVRAVMVRRASDPGDIKRGPVDAIVLDPVTLPSHHGPDVQSVLHHIKITTAAMIVPTTFMHMHVLQMTLKKPATRERVLELIGGPPAPRPGPEGGGDHVDGPAQGAHVGPEPLPLGHVGERDLRGVGLGRGERASGSSRRSTRRPTSWSRTWTRSARCARTSRPTSRSG